MKGGGERTKKKRDAGTGSTPPPPSPPSCSEPLVRCDAALAALDPPTRSRLTVHHADVADVDLHAVLSSAAPPGTPTLLFCNNLAFPPGTAVRHGRQYASWAASWGGPVAVVTSTPIDAGVGRAPASRLALTMNFNQGHEVCVYVWGEEEEGESDGQRRAGEGGRRLEAGEAAAA